MNKTSKGFTLIELLVVVAIIGLLASIITVAVSGTRAKARDARRLSDIQQIKTGLDLYFASGNAYPSKADFDNAATTGVILSCGTVQVLRVPLDPFNTLAYTYNYQNDGDLVPGCGTTGLSTKYNLSFVLERTGVTYVLGEDGIITPPLPQL